MLSSGGRRGMGGGGGGMLMKTFHRGVRAGVGGAPPNSNTNIAGVKAAEKAGFNSKRPISPNTALTLSPYSSAPFSPFINIATDESEWGCVDGIEDETVARGFYDNYVFGTVPSRDEVHHAVFALQQVAAKEKVDKVDEVSSGDLEEQVGNPVCGDDQSLYTEYSRSSDMAFHLLDTDSSVQRMVVSLSSDQAVWDAVMNNEVVKELRESIHVVGRESLNEGSDGEGGDESILEWIVMFAKDKIMAVLEKIRELMMIRPNPFSVDCGLNEKLKTSFFLSMLVMIIVVVARAKNNNA